MQLAVLWLIAGRLGIPDLVAFMCGWLAGWGHNFAWHRNKVFAHGEGSRWSQGPRSLVAALAGFVLQVAVFAGLKGPLSILLAGAVAAACSLPVTFLLSRRWAFGRPRPA